MFYENTLVSSPIHLFRTRLLPVGGTVNVRLGQKVNAADVIAEAVVPVRHELIDVVRIFKLSGPKAAEPLIQRQAGETLGENDIIAETGGLFSRVIRTPAPGKIISIQDGKVLLQTETKTISLFANYSGTISEVIPDRGAVIKVGGAVLQGVWGNGKMAVGPLLVKAETTKDELESADFEITARGSIIAAAVLLKPELLDIASALPIGGMILGSMPFALVEKALAQPYPIMLMEGFGKEGIDRPALKLLSLYNNRELTLNALAADSTFSLSRPEAVISAPVEAQTGTTNPQNLVRVHTGPLMGQTGVIDKVLPGLTLLPNGLRVRAASVIMENKERKTIPLNNLDGIGQDQSA